MKTVKSESAERPSLIDAISSNSIVYIRRNIKIEKRQDDNGNEYDWYIYDEEQWPRAHWEQSQIPQLSEKVDILMMMILESEGVIK